MTPSPLDPGITVSTITSFDGGEICVHRWGEGRPVVLIHGFLSRAQMNWIEFGTARQLVAAGFSLLMPDLRGHGASTQAGGYAPDSLSLDMASMLDHWAIDDYDCVGYSLGARTAIRLALQHKPPKKLVLAGMGYEGLIDGWTERRDWFLQAIAQRDNPQTAEQARVARFMKTMAVPADVAKAVLHSQSETSLADLRCLTMPILVLCGKDDQDNGSASALAAVLPNAHYKEIPGTHMSAITTPYFGQEISAFLRGSGGIEHTA